MPTNLTTTQAAPALDTDLFAYCREPLAYYLAPDAYAEIMGMKRPNIHTYTRLMPQVVGMAQRLHALIPQQRVWGKQLVSRRWATETFGEPVLCGLDRTRPGERLKVGDLVKHFLGRSYAVGTTDAPQPRPAWDEEKGELYTAVDMVNYLRLDVDQDDAWLCEDGVPILRELAGERAIAHACGLPFRAFRTGNRGFQAVIAFPFGMKPRLASFMLRSLLSVLAAREDATAKVDVDNLQKLVRLPGGVHASTGNLGLWIDIEGGRLYPLNTQMRLMTEGFVYPAPAILARHPEAAYLLWQRNECAAALREVAAYLDAIGVGQPALLDREQVDEIHRALPANAVVQRFAYARQKVEEENTGRRPVAVPVLIATTTETQEEKQEVLTYLLTQTSTPVAQEVPEDAEPLPVPTLSEAVPNQGEERDGYTLSWAVGVWQARFPPGGFWGWINMGGARGILAATVLFGKEEAEGALLRLVEEVPARSPSDLEARRFTVRNLWKSFKLKDFTAFQPRQKWEPPVVRGEATDETQTLAESIVGKMIANQKKRARWDQSIAERVIQTLMIGLRDAPTGQIEISYRTLCLSVNERWPDSPTNHMRVREVIERITPGSACLLEVFRKVDGVAWMSKPNYYYAGDGLRGTPLGQESEQRRIACAVQQDEEDELYDEEQGDSPLQEAMPSPEPPAAVGSVDMALSVPVEAQEGAAGIEREAEGDI